MAITYEEALATLEAMFGAPWTRESLDAILRHEKGHMENTCDRILSHGDKDPHTLVTALQHQSSLDEALAQQLQQGGSTPAAAPRAGITAPKRRGTPTDLPEEFLRIPGYKYPRLTSATAGAMGANMDDETLARMLQDELFSEELARNPDFAHLAGRGRSPASAAVPPGQRRVGASNARAPNPLEGVNVLESISKLGEGARRRLQMFAVNFENRLNGKAAPGSTPPRAGVLQEDAGAVAERRGLLDDDNGEEEIEFEMREKKSN